MNEVYYIHPSGLRFDTARLVTADEQSSYDISVVCLWLPNSTDDPMIMINWYCGEPNVGDTKRIADAWVNQRTRWEIHALIECQDLPNS